MNEGADMTDTYGLEFAKALREEFRKHLPTPEDEKKLAAAVLASHLRRPPAPRTLVAMHVDQYGTDIHVAFSDGTIYKSYQKVKFSDPPLEWRKIAKPEDFTP